MTEEDGREYTGPDAVEAPSDAQTQYREAEALYQSGQYAAAVTKFRDLLVFESSLDAEQARMLKYNLALAYALMGQLSDAQSFIAAYLQNATVNRDEFLALALYYCTGVGDMSRFPPA